MIYVTGTTDLGSEILLLWKLIEKYYHKYRYLKRKTLVIIF